MFVQGNAEIEGKDHRGWFIGHFMPESRSDIEIKWSHHPQGDGDPNFVSQRNSMSISILIRGSIRYRFLKDGVIESTTLRRPGDYVMWEPGIGHSWLVNENSDVITIRWPSLPNDTITEECDESSLGS